MIIGAGSESWRIVRDLAARLPFMLLPRCLQNLSQPVAIDDVVAALVRALDAYPPMYDISMRRMPAVRLERSSE